MFSYDRVKFSYDPFPIGLATLIMKSELYEQMVNNFPPLDIFENFEEMGKKDVNTLCLRRRTVILILSL